MTSKEREEKILANMNLVHAQCHKVYVSPKAFYDYEDIFQEGVMGLMEAVDKFNPDLGYEFSTYAVPMIRGKMLRFIRDNSNNLHYSRGDLNAYIKIQRFGKSYNELSKEELEELGITQTNLAAVISMINSMSLEDFVSSRDEDSRSLKEFISDSYYDVESYEFKKNDIGKVKDKVLEYYESDRDRDMLDEFYYSRIMYMNAGQQYLANKYGLSQAHVSRKINGFLFLLKQELIRCGYNVSNYMKDNVYHES